MNRCDVQFGVGGRIISSEMFQGEGNSAILFIHGYLSNRRVHEKYGQSVTNETGATCMAMDLGGHHYSTGNPSSLSIKDNLEEVKYALDFLTSRPWVDVNHIGVVGESYGGYLATHSGADNLVLGAPAIYPDELLEVPRGEYDMDAVDEFRRSLDPLPKNRALEAIAKTTGELIIVKNELDEDILPPVIDAYARAAPHATVMEIKGADHALIGDEQLVFESIIHGWVRKL